ncbi:MAG: acetolactate synthase small subunit [Lachnospiraceae bacterium]|jgi:acetolactate synthase-1/3 small subunit|nr:acetolactate synthase small subunit [Lachnospiraceae bacterium]MEE3461014.1 acetolactate synthase small subunit [Lachnospiraceae bacterium]
MKKKIFSILVDNTSGALSRVAGLFSRRGYNIDSLTVGTTEDPKYSRMTVVATGDDQTLEQICKQLQKLEDVITVKELEHGRSVTRELVLVTIKADSTARSEIVTLAGIFRANIVDVEQDSLMIEITGNKAKIDAFTDLVRKYGILELVRTGITGLARNASDNDEELSD